MATHTKPTNGERADEQQRDWHDRAHLEQLHVERGWSASDIAREFDIDARVVRERLKELELWDSENDVPTYGLARKVWEHGMKERDAL